MVDDIFIREQVDSDKIWNLCNFVKDNFAALNLEFSFDQRDVFLTKDIYIRNIGGKFKLSCMCQMWQKQAILKLFNCDKNPWQFEKDNQALTYDYLISKHGDFLNWGKPKDRWQWGIVKGKWTKECKDFFDKEGIEIDYRKRGFYE